jgi:hypothetical protein
VTDFGQKTLIISNSSTAGEADIFYRAEASTFAPSITAFGGKLWVAFIASNSSNTVLVCSSPDGQTWSANTPLHESIQLVPSLAMFGNKLWVAFIANNSTNTVLVCSSSDGQNWRGKR